MCLSTDINIVKHSGYCMAICGDEPVIRKVWAEQGQLHDTRKKIIERIEYLIKRPVLTYYTSFNYPVNIQDSDADLIEGTLQKLDLSKGLALIINSPGGSGTAAERIINICRKYSGTGEYWAIVPNRAKSAATMICFGASKIIMSGTSELGPIDPMLVFEKDGGELVRCSAHNLVLTYRKLFNTTIIAEGNLEPFIQQLEHFDAREIAELESAIELGKDIAIKALGTCMMKNQPDKQIENNINIFLIPKKKKVHERAIYLDEVRECNLKVEKIDFKDELWNLLYELHIRTNNLVSTNANLCIESKFHSFVRPVSKEDLEEGEEDE